MSSGDPPAASWREAEESSPAQRPAASSCSCCRGQTTPSGPAGTFAACRELRGPRRESGRARQPPTSLLHSLGRGKRRSASPKPSITPIGPTSALPSLTHAGGDGQDATAISARGEGRSSSAGPTAAPGRGETPPPAARLLSPPPFPPGLMDEHRARLEPAFPFGPRREEEREHGEQPGRCAPRLGRPVGVPFLQEDCGGRAQVLGCKLQRSLPQARSLKLSRALWRSWAFIWFPPF